MSFANVIHVHDGITCLISYDLNVRIHILSIKEQTLGFKLLFFFKKKQLQENFITLKASLLPNDKFKVNRRDYHAFIFFIFTHTHTHSLQLTRHIYIHDASF